jgi:hypothetical protein
MVKVQFAIKLLFRIENHRFLYKNAVFPLSDDFVKKVKNSVRKNTFLRKLIFLFVLTLLRSKVR